MKRAKKRAFGNDVRVEKSGFSLVVQSKKVPDEVAACESANGISEAVLAFQKKHFFGDRLQRHRGRRGRQRFVRKK